MLTLLKKSGQNAKPKEFAWRADFRDVQTLPDTKTVRTHFLINTLVYGSLSASILFLAYRETAVANLRTEIANLDAQITEAKPISERAVANYKLFQAEEARLKEVTDFKTSAFNFSDFVVRLGELFPIGVRANRIDLRGLTQNIVVLGEISGQDAQASATATEMISILQADPELKKHFTSIKLSNLGRNAVAGTLSFELLFEFPKPPTRPGTPASR